MNLKMAVIVGLLTLSSQFAQAQLKVVPKLCRSGADQINAEPKLQSALKGVNIFTKWELKEESIVVTMLPTGNASIQFPNKATKKIDTYPINGVLLCLEINTNRLYISIFNDQVKIDLAEDRNTAVGSMPGSNDKKVLTRVQ